MVSTIDDIAVVKRYLPDRGPNQHTLISTRNPNAHSILQVPLPETEQSIKMLCHLLGMDPESHRIPSNAVVEELKHLPLAIEQAASYVWHITRGFAIYLAEYRCRRPELHR